MTRALLVALLLLLPLPAAAERQFMSGFDNADCDEFKINTQANCVGTITFDTTTKRSGTHSMKAASTAAASNYVNLGNFDAQASGEIFYFRAYIYIADAPDADTVIFAGHSTAASRRYEIALTSGLALQLMSFDGAAQTQIGSNSSTLSLNTWYRIELSGEWDTDGCEARLDGTTFASGTCAGNVVSNAFRLGIGINGTVANTTIYFDDFAFNDATGTQQTSWPGEGKIVYLRPNGAGDADTSVTLTGCATDAWNCVKEVTGDDSTTRADLTATTSLIDVALDDPSAPDSDDTVTCVGVGVMWASAGAGAAGLKLRIKGQSSGTVVTGTALSNATSVYYAGRQSGVRPAMTLVCYTNPQGSTCTGGSAWTATSLGTMQIGADANADGNPDSWVTQLWAMVEYVEVTGGGGGPTGTKKLLTLGVGERQ
jgi:hypothetical protein